MSINVLDEQRHALNDSANQRIPMLGPGVRQFDVMPVEQLSDELQQDWETVRGQNAAFRSPFFSHEYVLRVARRVPGIELAVLRVDGRNAGFLPFQRVGRSGARPAGAGVNDAHGFIIDAAVEVDWGEALRAIGLAQFAFHAAPVGMPGLEPYETGRVNSFLADLTVDPEGYEHFLRSRNSTIDRQGQKTRRLIKDVGPLRFEFDCRDPLLLEQLIQLKRSQYQRTHTYDILSQSWIRGLFHDLHSETSGKMRGLLSVLWAGRTPVALHFGMIEGDLLHYWFPVYDPQYNFGSPGTQLFLEVAKTAAAQGVKAIDMGYGEQAYKHKLTNVISQSSYGLVTNSRWRRTLFQTRQRLRLATKEFGLRKRLKPIARRLLPHLGQSEY